jgi:hypothetical protein
MLSFPVLSSQPVYYYFTETLHADPVITTQAEQGCILSRLRSTVSYKHWVLQYRGVSSADKLTVEAFQASVGVGADKWLYTVPTDNTAYVVRFTAPIQFRLDPQHKCLWQIDCAIYGETAFAASVDGYYSELAVLIPQLGAGVDVTNRPVFACPHIGTMKSVGILYNGAPSGIDNANTAVLTLKDGSGAVVATKTYDLANQPPTSAYDSLDGSLDESLAAGEVWTLTIVQGASADLAECYVVSIFYVGA